MRERGMSIQIQRRGSVTRIRELENFSATWRALHAATIAVVQIPLACDRVKQLRDD
jgi:hypothetical protein